MGNQSNQITPVEAAVGRAPPERLTVLKVAVVSAAEVDTTLDLRRVLLPPLLGRRERRSCFLL